MSSALDRLNSPPSGTGAVNAAGFTNGLPTADNQVVRTDATSGAIQGSSVTLGDGGAAGTPVALSVSSLTATASTQAGQGYSITADNAIAGTTNAGAAAGGSITLTAGAAARLTSGNANGGNIIFTPGSGIGTGVVGKIAFTAFDGTHPSLRGDTTGLRLSDSGDNPFPMQTGTVQVYRSNYTTGTENICLNPASYYIGVFAESGNPSIRFSVATNAENNHDIILSRGAASVLSVDTTSVGNHLGWIASAGTSYVTGSDVTNNGTTLSAITGLSSSFISGRSYRFRIVLKCINSVAAEGIKFDLNGGAGTATTVWAGLGVIASGGTDTVGTNISTSLSGGLNYTTLTGETVLVIEGYIKCNASGTFIPRFAENTTATGTATIRVGSFMEIQDLS